MRVAKESEAVVVSWVENECPLNKRIDEAMFAREKEKREEKSGDEKKPLDGEKERKRQRGRVMIASSRKLVSRIKGTVENRIYTLPHR